MEEIISVWLVPIQEDKAYLQDIIDRLSVKHSATAFTPHLTLFGAQKKIDLRMAKRYIDESVKDLSPFSAIVSGLNYTDDFFKTVFVEIEENEQLLTFYDNLKARFKEYGDYMLKPHISLIYKTMPSSQKEEIIRDLKAKRMIKPTVTFDRAILSMQGNKEHGWHDIAGWKVVYEQKLGA